MNLFGVIMQLGGDAAGGGMNGLLMMALVFVVLYFFMIRPQVKKQKEVKKAREAMKAGDKVVTAGGLYGKIKEMKDTTVLIEIADGVKVTVDKNSVFAQASDMQQK